MSLSSDSLNIPETMPVELAEFLRKRSAGSRAFVGLINSKLEATPPGLWKIADRATRGLGHREWALRDLLEIITSSTGLLPTETIMDKAKAQTAAAKALAVAKTKCGDDAYANTADLKDLLAISAATQADNRDYVAAVAALLSKLGSGNTGITLPQLLSALASALHESADALKSKATAPLQQVTAEPLRAEFSASTARRFENALAAAQGFKRKTIKTTPNGRLVVNNDPLPSGVCLQLHSRSASFSPVGIDFQPVLYGPFEPVHDADFPKKSAPEPQENHSYVATQLLRWMRTYTGKPHRDLVQNTVDSLVGHRDGDKDYMTQAERNARRSPTN